MLAFLNSSLYQWRFKVTSTNNNVGTNELESLPIRVLDPNDADDNALNKLIVAAVTDMLDVQSNLHRARVAHSTKQQLEKRVAYLASRIDKLVFKAFSLDDDDIAALTRFSSRSVADDADLDDLSANNPGETES